MAELGWRGKGFAGQFKKRVPSAAEAAIDYRALTARLKPRPFKAISNQSHFKLTH